ncbi:hypothetical protein GCM10009069_24030 [Algimonas arctica]|uniref:LysM domain-containing protein n=1 Tax=Algimonas arctica TaxID=1479486 RepID=A0A8J3CTW4_9PROT|nr:LysM domain-containing protein [Algimonas arctica]GHB00432.1 hypothetical protein GCM10009069_24030 [Algimonas arctica]
MSARLLLLGTSILLASCATAQENPNYQHSTKYGVSQTQVATNGTITPNTTPRVQTASAQTDPRVMQTADPQTSSQYGAPTHHAGTQTNVTHTHAMGADHHLSAPHAIESDHIQTGYVGNEGVTLAAANPAPPQTSPTERAYNSNQMQGTPGYEMMRAQQSADDYSAAPAPEYTPYTPPLATPPAATGPRQITYDYGDNVSVSDTGSNRSSGPSYDQMSDQGRTGTAANIATGQSYMVREGDTVYSLSRRLCAPMADITTANAIGGDYAISIGQTLYLPNSRC